MKKQKTIKIKLGDNMVVSKPFDFEALCLINDKHGSGSAGLVVLGSAALAYMFEGTEVTQSVLDALPMDEKVALCMKIASFYTETIASANKHAAKNA